MQTQEQNNSIDTNDVYTTQDMPVVPLNAASRNNKVDKFFTILLVVLLVVLVLFVVLRLFVVTRIAISGDSMLPNFHDGQIVWINKTASIKRGDVVVFYRFEVQDRFSAEFSFGKQDPKYEKLIKRVVALAGDKMWVDQLNGDWVLTVETTDGKVLTENYYTVGKQAAQFYDKAGNLCDIPYLGPLGGLVGTTKADPYIVADGCFFFLGDNRHNSNDARSIGELPLERIYGVVMS